MPGKTTVRQVVSLTVTLAFLALVYTGLALYVAPPGRVANWSGWTLLGLRKDQYADLHTVFMVLFILGSALHIWFNWNILLAYWRNTARRVVVLTPGMLAALGICAVTAVGTLAGLPPMQQIVNVGESVKQSWEDPAGAAPYAHAELSTLPDFARHLGRPIEDLVSRLRERGYEIVDLDRTIREVATANGRTPQELFRSLQTRGAEDGSLSATPAGGGLGRRTLADLAASGQINLEAALTALRDRGLAARPEDRVRDVADRLGVSPQQLVDQLPRP